MNPTVSSAEQERLVKFLQLPASYPHKPSEVHAIETHISWVFIASPFVFKVKRPVNLGFLDFSTLEQRHHFCRRELELNSRLCPDVYLAVMPIFENDGRFSFDDDGGEIVEYALKMRELARGWFLSELLARGAVTETEINRVIARLHPFYESQTPSPEIEEWGTPQKLKISTDENFAQIRPFIGKTISPVAFETIRHFTDQFYTRNAQLFHERIAQHRILDCHGDLRLDHVHITPEAVTIFDCIEFNDRFRFIDIANDLAFLAMDFDFERKHKLGALFLHRATEALRDPGILKVADFYKCYRAFVRGKVESIQSELTEAAVAQEHAQRAKRYFRLALRYAISGSEPVVFVIMGRVGTGKTTFAQELGRQLDWPVISSDQIRKTLAGVPLTQRTPPLLREKVYSAPMSEETYGKVLEEGLRALDANGGVILDATFSKRANRDVLREACGKAHVRLQVIELEASDSEIVKRLKARSERTFEISDARLEDFEKLSGAYEPPIELGPALIKLSSEIAIGDSLKAALLEMAKRQAQRQI